MSIVNLPRVWRAMDRGMCRLVEVDVEVEGIGRRYGRDSLGLRSRGMGCRVGSSVLRDESWSTEGPLAICHPRQKLG